MHILDTELDTEILVLDGVVGGYGKLTVLNETSFKVERSPDSVRWQVRLFSRIADPLHAFILVLLGVPTILWRNSRNIFLSAIATMVVSTLYFVSYVVLLNLGNRGFISPGLAAGLAPVLFGALGFTLYLKMPS